MSARLPAKRAAWGVAVHGSTTGRPIMVLLDLLGRRWTLRLLWELRGAPLTFVQLRTAADGLSQSVLTLRLSELKSSGLIAASPEAGYTLTPAGREIVERLGELDKWADRWAADLPVE